MIVATSNFHYSQTLMTSMTTSRDIFEERLEAHRGSLTSASLRVVEYIDANRTTVLASSAVEIAAQAATSDATVVRTAQLLGFSGMSDLKRALLAAVEAPSTLVDDMRLTLGEVGEDAGRAIDTVIEAHDESMQSLRRPEARARIRTAVETLHPAERLAVFGIGPSAALATYMATLLNRAGRRALVLNTTGAMLADQMLDLRKGDAVVALAYGRAYGEIRVVVSEARRLGLPIVLITDSLDEKLARFAQVILPARRGRADRVALHGATLVCLEALVLGLAAANKETVPTLERLKRLREDVRNRPRQG